MILTIGDKGIVVKYINSFFGIDGDIYTEETKKKVMQFQQSFQQQYPNNPSYPYVEEDIINSYTRVDKDEENPENLKVLIREILPVLFPNGKVDIFTMNAILGNEIDYNDFQKILQVRKVLNGTEYSNFGNIFLMLCEMAKNLNYRLDDNLDFVPVIVKEEIKRIVAADDTSYGGSDQIFERNDLVDYHLAEMTIFGKNEYVGDKYRNKFGEIINVTDIDDKITHLAACWNYVGNNQGFQNQSRQSPNYVEDFNHINLTTVDQNNINLARLSEIERNLSGRISDSIHELECANFKILPGNYDDPQFIPQLGDYIMDPATRQLYLSTLGDQSRFYISRTLKFKSNEKLFKEYLIWVDRYWNISNIQEISFDSDGTKITSHTPPSSNEVRVLYLCCASEDTSVEIKHLGIYFNAHNHYLETPNLYNLFGAKDENDLINGKFIRRISKIQLTPANDWELENDNGRVRFKLNTEVAYYNTNSILCSHFVNYEESMELDLEAEFIKAENNFLYFYPNDDIQSLSDWEDFLIETYDEEKPLTIWYRNYIETYWEGIKNQINVEGFRLIISDATVLNIQYRLNSKIAPGEDDIYRPNPYYPGYITGVGEGDSLQIYSENKDKSKMALTTIPLLSGPLYGFDDEFGDSYNISSGIISRKCGKLILDGDETAIDLSPYSNEQFCVFGIPNVLHDRRLTYAGMCNYFEPLDDIWIGQRQGFTFDSSASQNIYISMDIKLLKVSHNSSPIQKIEAFRAWLRSKINTPSPNPVTLYWVSNKTLSTESGLTTYLIPQYEEYTRVYNNYNANTLIRLHVIIDLNRGEVQMAGLYDEGVIDLAQRLPDVFDQMIGSYDKHLIETLRLYQMKHDIGQDTPYGRYYSGILNTPTYNMLKKEFEIQEVVI